jgi:hypothetical protein
MYEYRRIPDITISGADFGSMFSKFKCCNLEFKSLVESMKYFIDFFLKTSNVIHLSSLIARSMSITGNKVIDAKENMAFLIKSDPKNNDGN